MKQILIIGRKIDNTYKYIVLVEAGVGIQTLNKVFEKKLLGDLSFHRFQTWMQSLRFELQSKMLK